ncbi:GAF and ANTAR domain-containing protein [Amycolatopsis coloradensis]|uniref:GAF and ANTAR domain-containing protein n=1 Tax=Amycolatopsis coloradensis TaxID=76021 RepID=A0ACD5BUK8_9PSEU
MADALVELTDTVVKDFGLPERLARLAARCIELFDISAAAVMLASQDDGRWRSATAGESADLLDVLNLARLDGPVLGSFRAGELVGPMDLAGAGRRWPDFAAAVDKAGYRQVCSVPIRLREEEFGSVLLLHSETDGLSMAEVRLVQALADAAAIGHVHEREIRRQIAAASQLQAAPHSRVLIEQAKGFLAARCDTNVHDAFELIRGHARRHRSQIHEVARHVISHGTLPTPSSENYVHAKGR